MFKTVVYLLFNINGSIGSSETTDRPHLDHEWTTVDQLGLKCE